MSSPWKGSTFVLVVAALICGLIGLFYAVNNLIAIAVAVVALALLWPRTWPRLDLFLLHSAGAVAVAVLVLAGLNFLTYQGGLRQLPIVLGLIWAVGVFGIVAFWYLRRAGWKKRNAAGLAAGLAIGLILVVPWIVEKEDADSVPVAKQVPSELDVAIIGDGRRHPTPEALKPNPTLEKFKVRYSVGFARGEEVKWTLLEERDRQAALEALASGAAAPVERGRPEPEPETDSILLLLVDGTDPVSGDPASLPERDEFQEGEVPYWQRIAAAAAPGVPAFALLQTTDENRLQEWQGFGPPGSVVSIQELGSQSVADAAVQLAVSSPTSPVDLGLATAFRPILLFDSEEPVPWPHSIDGLFEEGRVKLCHDELTTDCEPLKEPSELKSGGTHLQLDTRDEDELRFLAKRELDAQEDGSTPTGANSPPGMSSAIYVHPVSITRDREQLLYLDYWWYLPDNPVEVGGGIICGAGFVIAGVTCLSHQSDWEGMTVVVDRSGPEPKIRAVHYAQHDSVVRYSWEELQARWEKSPRLQKLTAKISDASTRPLAFVAKGTHATYPFPCFENCEQDTNSTFKEDSHNGGFGWVGNDTAACLASICLQTFPTRARGAEPALWNAYEGPWGKRSCFLAYCDSGSPPTAPGQQGRFEDPTRYDK
ncbi:MAG TPA: hypothetical protein VGV34_05260 [Solirubrobacterales bacterium]|nr:hypothetical protein [Solirubrobacterales bacterium]